VNPEGFREEGSGDVHFFAWRCCWGAWYGARLQGTVVSSGEVISIHGGPVKHMGTLRDI
jgi:hypothetical protein